MFKHDKFDYKLRHTQDDKTLQCSDLVGLISSAPDDVFPLYLDPKKSFNLEGPIPNPAVHFLPLLNITLSKKTSIKGALEAM